MDQRDWLAERERYNHASIMQLTERDREKRHKTRQETQYSISTGNHQEEPLTSLNGNDI